MTREQLEMIEHAMQEMYKLVYSLDEQGKTREAKRVETILGKLYDLKTLSVSAYR